jgi:hypothetical protein
MCGVDGVADEVIQRNEEGGWWLPRLPTSATPEAGGTRSRKASAECIRHAGRTDGLILGRALSRGGGGDAKPIILIPADVMKNAPVDSR